MKVGSICVHQCQIVGVDVCTLLSSTSAQLNKHIKKALERKHTATFAKCVNGSMQQTAKKRFSILCNIEVFDRLPILLFRASSMIEHCINYFVIISWIQFCQCHIILRVVIEKGQICFCDEGPIILWLGPIILTSSCKWRRGATLAIAWRERLQGQRGRWCWAWGACRRRPQAPSPGWRAPPLSTMSFSIGNAGRMTGYFVWGDEGIVACSLPEFLMRKYSNKSKPKTGAYVTSQNATVHDLNNPPKRPDTDSTRPQKSDRTRPNIYKVNPNTY